MKGLATVPIIIIFFFIFTIGAFILQSTNHVDNLQIGDVQRAVMDAYDQGEESLLYLDQAAELSLRNAVQQLIDHSGYFIYSGESAPDEEIYECGSLIYPLWTNAQKECIPAIEDNYKEYVSLSLEAMLAKHPFTNFPTHHDIYVTSYNPLTVNGVADGSLIIPITSAQQLYTQPITRLPDYALATFPLELPYKKSRFGKSIRSIVTHWTATKDLDGAVRALQQRQLSYHYLISRDGSVSQYVKEAEAAWHAGCDGPTCLRQNMNSQSIGISFVSCGYSHPGCELSEDAGECVRVPGKVECYQPYTPEQLASYVDLVADIAYRHESFIPGEFTMFDHTQVRSDKPDPGPLFSLQELLPQINAALEARRSTEVIGGTGGKITGDVTVTSEQRGVLDTYEAALTSASITHGVPASLIKAVIMQESKGNPSAVSFSGCAGLMQFCYGTAKQFDQFTKLTPCCPTDGGTCNLCNTANDDRFNHLKSIDAGAEYLSDLLGRFDGYNAQIPLAIASYNGGPGLILTAVAKAERQGTPRRELSWLQVQSVLDAEMIGDVYGGRYAQDTTLAQAKVREIRTYVERVMDYYLEFGGTAVIDRMGEYKLVTSFSREENYDLEPVQDAEQGAHALIGIHDNPQLLASQLLDDVHARIPTFSLSSASACEEKPVSLFADVVLRYQNCLDQLAPSESCNVSLDWDVYGEGTEPYKLTILFEEDTLSLVREDEVIKKQRFSLPVTPVGNDGGRKTFKLIFSYEGGLFTGVVLSADTGDITFDRVIGFKKEDDGTLAVTQPLGNDKLVIDHYLRYCAHRDNNTIIAYVTGAEDPFVGLRNDPFYFSLYLEDRIPPQSTGFSARYETDHFNFQWLPKATYADGLPVEDFSQWRLYCSSNPLSLPLQADDLGATITHQDGYFSSSYLLSAPVITISLSSCRDASLTESSHVALVGVDSSGQLSDPLFLTLNEELTDPLPYLAQVRPEIVVTPS